MTFLNALPPLARALAEKNYAEPTPVQAAVLADEAVGRDLLVSAQTGSGKTVAYGLAIANELLGDAGRLPRGGAPLALIVAPTRELALQVHRELSWLYGQAGARVVSCVGGMDPRKEMRELADGAHIVVGTPGRLCDHLRRGRLDVSSLKAVVLDEADEMLDLGFREDMEIILKTTPATRRTLLFSATLPRGIVQLAKQYQQNAFRVDVAGDEGGHADIDYRAIRIAAQDAEHAVVNTLRFYESPSAIVFCNTRNAVKHLQAILLERGFSVVALSGELTQNERTTALQSLRDGRARVCVATDVAARGIDLPNLGLVIHADLPNDAEVMQHRSGRTGRAGRKGVSVLLVPPARRRRAESLLRDAAVDATWGVAPSVDEIRVLDQQRMMKDVLFTEEPTEDDLTLARQLLAERSPEEIASALARLYRARLPAAEDIMDPGARPAPGAHTSRPLRERESAGRMHERRDNDGDAARPKKGKSREAMAGGVWFRAAIGRRKNAEARWLLPMICRRGGIEKADIGAIKIYDTTSEFEISAAAAESFAVSIKRPDKEDTIRIEALPNGPQGETSDASVHSRPQARVIAPEDRDYSKKRERFKGKPDRDAPRHDERPRREDFIPKDFATPEFKPWQDKDRQDKGRQDKDRQDKGRQDQSRSADSAPPRRDRPWQDQNRQDSNRQDQSRQGDKPRFDKPKFDKPGFDKKPRAEKPPYVAKAKRDGAVPYAGKPSFGKKKNKARD